MNEADTCRYLERVFANDLQGHELLANDFVKWVNFLLVKNQHWSYENVVLLGDALHTAHFSIGSGTKLALEDAIGLHKSFQSNETIKAALEDFEQARKPVIEKYQAAARASLLWFENAKDDLHLAPLDFAYKIMTRSTRITHERLKERAPEFVADYEQWKQGLEL